MKPLKVNIFTVTAMAMTQRTEGTLQSMTDTQFFFTKGRKTVAGKLKENVLILPATLPAKADSDGDRFAGNACLNLVFPADWSDGKAAREVEEMNLNPNFSAWDTVLRIYPAYREVPLFPDSPTSHAVVQRVRKLNS